jgi:hypothetical protein
MLMTGEEDPRVVAEEILGVSRSWHCLQANLDILVCQTKLTAFVTESLRGPQRATEFLLGM